MACEAALRARPSREGEANTARRKQPPFISLRPCVFARYFLPSNKKPRAVSGAGLLLKDEILEGSCIVCLGLVPVHHVPPGLEVVGASVLVVEIIGVLPDIVAENRLS